MIKPPEIVKEGADREGKKVGPKPSAPAPTGPPKSTIREYFEQGVVTVIMALFLITFIAQAVQVPTGSLQNNIYIGDHLFVNKFLFGRQTPVIGKLLPAREVRRGDIVVFKLPSNPKVNYVKRVIGLPGDEVSVRGRHVYVNGQELPEQHVIVQLQLPAEAEKYSSLPELKTEPAPPGATYKVYYDKDRNGSVGGQYAVNGPIIVPPNNYFVMGDSRDNSLDSRFWGFVPRDNIIGRALYVYWSYNPNQPDERGAVPENQSGLRRLLNFFTKTNWRRTGKAIK